MNPSSVLQLLGLSTIKLSALSLKGAESHIVIPVTVKAESVTGMTRGE